jgi:hypothetical protein
MFLVGGAASLWEVANISRLLYPLHTHAEATPEDNEGKASRKDKIRR